MVLPIVMRDARAERLFYESKPNERPNEDVPIFLVIVSFEQTTENPFLLWFEWRHSQLFSDFSDNFLLVNIRAFRHELFANHDCRGSRQFRTRPFIGSVFSERL